MDIAGLASLAHASPPHLREQMAATLLQSTDRPVLGIALDVGYPTLSGFNRHVKAIHGTSGSVRPGGAG